MPAQRTEGLPDARRETCRLLENRNDEAWIAVALVMLVGGATVASAGQQPSAGAHVAQAGSGSGGEFSVSSGGTTVTWVDGREYNWVPSPPPEGNGYYSNSGPPARTLTFHDGSYEWSDGYGTYTPL
jgi:hypothetical protein